MSRPDASANVLVTDEWNPLDQPGGRPPAQVPRPRRRHRPDRGGRRGRAGDARHDQVRNADPGLIAEARAKVFKLDERAYVLAEDVWRGTPRAEFAP